MESNPCIQCGNPVRCGAKFCPTCGAAVIQPAPTTSGDVPANSNIPVQLQCPGCGSSLRTGARFCPRCGRAVIEIDRMPTPAGGGVEKPGNQPPPFVPGIPVQPPPVYIPQTQQPAPGKSPRTGYRLLHIGMIALLMLCIAAGLVAAFLLEDDQPTTTLATPQVTPEEYQSVSLPTALPSQQNVAIGITDTGRFGLSTTGNNLPEDLRNKNLTFSSDGATNNTRVWIDGQTPVFGYYDQDQYNQVSRDTSHKIWKWQSSGVQVTQTLDTVSSGSDSSSMKGDTLRIEYVLENLDTVDHQVGLRVMIDTLIGSNDGVPFLIPGREGITLDAVDLTGEEIPDVIQALEVADLVDPGVIVNLTLRGVDATPPDRVLITGWFDSEMPWDFLSGAGGEGAPLKRGGQSGGEPDSAVGLFYQPATLTPGQSRTIILYYGLGRISSTSTGNKKLGLFGLERVNEGDQFYLSAVVSNPSNSQEVEITLPAGLQLAEGETAQKDVASQGQPYTQVSWLLQTCSSGENQEIQVRLNPDDVTERWIVDVVPVGITRPGGTCP